MVETQIINETRNKIKALIRSNYRVGDNNTNNETMLDSKHSHCKKKF